MLFNLYLKIIKAPRNTRKNSYVES